MLAVVRLAVTGLVMCAALSLSSLGAAPAGVAYAAATYNYDRATPNAQSARTSAPPTSVRMTTPVPRDVARRSANARFADLLAAKAGARGVDQGFAVGQGFRSFNQFKRVLGPAGLDKQWHHLVEQTPANIARFGPEAVHNTGNLVRLEVKVHGQVSGYYSSKQSFTGGQTVRQWLSGQSYARQQQFAREILDRFRG